MSTSSNSQPDSVNCQLDQEPNKVATLTIAPDRRLVQISQRTFRRVLNY